MATELYVPTTNPMSRQNVNGRIPLPPAPYMIPTARSVVSDVSTVRLIV